MLITRAKLLSRILGQSRNRTISSTSALLSSDIKFRECYGSFIDGSELDVNKFNQSTFMVENPATSEIICKVASANKAVVDHACEVASRTYDSGVWSRSDVRHRAAVLSQISILLKENINDLAELEVVQTGRSVREMKAQLARLPEWFDYFGALIRTHEGTVPPFWGEYINYVQRVPLGVCGLLTPWNHPLLIAIKKIAPAIATGNSIVLKPSELAPISVLELAALCTKAGLPDGVLNIVPGMGPEAGQAICANEVIRKVDLTGRQFFFSSSLLCSKIKI
jgi:acyl-CoA reductase-like NAD-dependent aldehyde dehydrogenase